MKLIYGTYPWLVADSVLETIHKSITMPLLYLGVLLITYIAAATYFVEVANYWYWEPFWTAPILVLIYMADCFFAIVRTGRVKGLNFEFHSNKFQKFIVDVIGVLIILGLMHAFPLIGKRMMKWDPTTTPERADLIYRTLIMGTWLAYFAIATRQGLSAVGNAAKAGIIPKGAAKVISRHIDSYKRGVYDDE